MRTKQTNKTNQKKTCTHGECIVCAEYDSIGLIDSTPNIGLLHLRFKPARRQWYTFTGSFSFTRLSESYRIKRYQNHMFLIQDINVWKKKVNAVSTISTKKYEWMVVWGNCNKHCAFISMHMAWSLVVSVCWLCCRAAAAAFFSSKCIHVCLCVRACVAL